MEYTIITAGDDKLLIDKVNEMLAEGWETEGGVAVTSEGVFCQAMILFDDEGDEYETGEELQVKVLGRIFRNADNSNKLSAFLFFSQ